MGEIKIYNIDIVKRTKEILDDYYVEFEKRGREVTFLMNCLLGIIIVITETEKRNRNLSIGEIDENFIQYIPDKIGFVQLL